MPVSGTMTLGGRPLRINLARDAATAGDVWLYDEKTRVAVLGDLVTLPAPFLDTACPEGWKVALRQVADTPFEMAIPGHWWPADPCAVSAIPGGVRRTHRVRQLRSSPGRVRLGLG